MSQVFQIKRLESGLDEFSSAVTELPGVGDPPSPPEPHDPPPQPPQHEPTRYPTPFDPPTPPSPQDPPVADPTELLLRSITDARA